MYEELSSLKGDREDKGALRSLWFTQIKTEKQAMCYRVSSYDLKLHLCLTALTTASVKL